MHIKVLITWVTLFDDKQQKAIDTVLKLTELLSDNLVG